LVLIGSEVTMRKALYRSAVSAAILCMGIVPSVSADARPPADPIPSIVREVNADNIKTTISRLVSFGTRSTLSSQDDPVRGIGAARRWLAAQLKAISASSGGKLRVEEQTFIQPTAARIPRPTSLTNIVATLPGTLTGAQARVLVVSGHYDTMCTSPTDPNGDAPGADDDGSGTAAVLELARVLSAHGPYAATIVFLMVPGEEQGLLGSGHFARTASESLMPIEAMFTNDIIGSSTGADGTKDSHSVRVFSEGVPTAETAAQAEVRRSIGGENDSRSRQLARLIQESAKRYVPAMHVRLIYRRDRYLRGGDHIPFLERGFPAVRFTEPNEDYRHQHQNVRTENGIVYGDLQEFTDPEYIANVARVNAAALAEMALAPAPPPRVGVLVSGLAVDTTITWRESAGAAGYELLWRETTDPVWTHKKWVGKALKAVVPMSKDNVIFGVRALDNAGHRSVVVTPMPIRSAN
jgi:Peptidase family M28